MNALQFLASKTPSAGAYLLTGGDDFLREAVLVRLRSELIDKDFAEFNHSVVRCAPNTRAAAISDALFELPMMCDRRLLELRSVQLLPPKLIEGLKADFVKAVESGSIAVVLSLESVEAAKKGQPRKTEFSWTDGLKGAVTIHCALEDKDVPGWISRRAQELGLHLGSTAGYLQERVGRDLRLLDAHLQKLRLYQGVEGSIGVPEIEKMVPLSVEVQTWKLTAAIGSKNVNNAYRVLDSILEQGEAPGAILSYINSYLLSLAEVKELKQRLGNVSAIAAAMPRKSEYQLKKNLEEAGSWSEAQLSAGFERLMRADYRMKTGSEPLMMLQLTLLQLCLRGSRG
jgi:DNA polymerase III delta subunit